MSECAFIAEKFATESFLNCAIREILDYYLVRMDELALETFQKTKDNLKCPWLMVIPLKTWEKEILVPLSYFSPLGAHRMILPLYLRSPLHPPANSTWEKFDFPTLVAMVLREISVLKEANGELVENLFLRILQSKEVTEEILNDRRKKIKEGIFHSPLQTFLSSEQGLWAGHPYHPSPKSREGWTAREREIYSAEMGGHFPLHYFLVHRQLVKEGSALAESATTVITRLFFDDPELKHEDRERVKRIMLDDPHYVLYPLHPWQAKENLLQDEVQEMIKEQALIDLGPMGRSFYPTSSQRTLYHPDVPFMIKFSLGVKITNSKRINLYKELVRSLETHAFLQSSWGKDLQKRFPTFKILTDPAYLALDWKGKVRDEFSLVLRENPFHDYHQHPQQKVWMLAALCQHVPEGEKNPLYRILAQNSAQEGRSLEEVGLTWFEMFLNLALRPYLEIYYRYGYAFEAHQQNTLIELDGNGYPSQFYYRDNQGCFHRDSIHDRITQLIPGLGEKSESYGPQELVEERMIYYFFINNIFTLINAMGVHGVVREEKLLKIVSLHLKELVPLEKEHNCALIQHLFNHPTLLCKGNLLTRYYDMDELIGDPATQSVYMDIPNPFYWSERKGVIVAPSESCLYFRHIRQTRHTLHVKNSHFSEDTILSFRPFQLERDLDLIHQWMNKPFVARFWNLNKSKEELRKHFIKVMENCPRHMTPLIGMMNGKSMSYWEKYWVKEDILGKLPEVQWEEFDQGLHLLIGEEDFLGQGRCSFMIAAFCQFLFQDERTQRVFGEPDARNHSIIKYASPLGFNNLGDIQLPNKKAVLLECTRKNVYAPDWFSGVRQFL